MGAEDLPADPAVIGASAIALPLRFSALVRGPGPGTGDHAQSHTRKGRGSRSPAATRGSRPPCPEVAPPLQRPEPGGGVGSWSPGLGCHRAAGRGRPGARLGLELQVRGGAG